MQLDKGRRASVLDFGSCARVCGAVESTVSLPVEGERIESPSEAYLQTWTGQTLDSEHSKCTVHVSPKFSESHS